MPLADSLIVGLTSGLVGGAGGVWLQGHFAFKMARNARDDGHADQRRSAYEGLLVTARLARRNLSQQRLMYAHGHLDPEDSPIVREVQAASNRLADELNQAVVTVQLVGSPAAREHAGAVFDAVRDATEVYQERLRMLNTLPRRAAVPPFDDGEINRRLKGVDHAIDAFITAVRPEMPSAVQRR